MFPLVCALGFSPANLVYIVGQNQELCQHIQIESSSEIITVEDAWAENPDIEWKVDLFEHSALDHGLTISYPTELSLEERDIEVCISGAELGEYHGATIIREQQEGDSISRAVVWLKVVVEEYVPEPPPQQEQNPGDDSPGSSGSGRRDTTPEIEEPVQEEPETPEPEVELLAAEIEPSPEVSTEAETDNTVEETPLFTVFRIIPVVFIVFLVIASLYVRKKRRSFLKPDDPAFY